MKPADMLARISGREQAMLGALVLVGFMIWGSVLLGKWETLSAKHKQVRREFDKQAIWLADADRFEQQLEERLAALDAAQTYNAEGLVGLVDELARQGGLTHDLGTPTTRAQNVFVKHSLKVGVKNARLEKLINFERALREVYPYVAFEDVSLSANKADPRLLNARLTLASYQLTSQAEQTLVGREN
jgi:Tfp pilus assembly protein PilO